MAYKNLQLRRDTAAIWTNNNPTLLIGEIGYETDTNKIKIGDGSTAWDSLSYLSGVSGVDTSGTPEANDYARFTDVDTIEGRNYSEVKTDLSLNLVENTALSTWAGSTNITTLGTITTCGGITLTNGGTITSTGLTVDYNTLFVDSTNHRVGLGTNAPQRQLVLASTKPTFVLKESINNLGFVIYLGSGGESAGDFMIGNYLNVEWTSFQNRFGIKKDGGIVMFTLKAGANQAAAGAAAKELYRDTDDNSIKIGV